MHASISARSSTAIPRVTSSVERVEHISARTAPTSIISRRSRTNIWTRITPLRQGALADAARVLGAGITQMPCVRGGRTGEDAGAKTTDAHLVLHRDRPAATHTSTVVAVIIEGSGCVVGNGAGNLAGQLLEIKGIRAELVALGGEAFKAGSAGLAVAVERLSTGSADGGRGSAGCARFFVDHTQTTDVVSLVHIDGGTDGLASRATNVGYVV